MAITFDRKTLRIIARRTLCRAEGDERQISSIYFTHLKHFLAAHPDEQDFTIDLDNGDGSVFCRACERRLPPGDGEPEEDGKDIFGSMNNFTAHLKTTEHRHRKIASASNSARLPISQENAMPGPSSSSRKVVDLTSSSPARQNASSSLPLQPLQQEIDEDYLLALKLHEELNGPIRSGNGDERQQESLGSDAMDVDEPNLTLAHNGSSQPTAVVQHESDEPEEEFPFEETYHAQIQGILINDINESPNSYALYRESAEVIQVRCRVCHYSVAMPGSGSFEACLDDVMQGVNAYEEHLQSPLHVRKRDETANQISGQQSSSIPTAQLNSYTTSSAPPQIGAPQVEYISAGKRKLPGAWYENEPNTVEGSTMANPFAPGDHGFTSTSAVHQPNNFIMQQMDQGMAWPHTDNAMHDLPTPFLNRPVMPIPTNLQNPFPEGSTQHDARNVAIRRFHESQVATLEDYGTRDTSSNFNIRYDDAGPVGRIDLGGPDLDKRFKDFMNKALEEFKDVTTVTDAQKKLNMQTETDRLDGMQVCLLPHQIVGVAWMIDQERDKGKLGGILADAMGLGKTVQMIATMVINRPPRREIEHDFFERHTSGKGKGKELENVRRTTLVLAPASLLQQWYEELDDKTTPGVFRVHIHHGKDKLKTVKEIEEYDVIIASHQSVVMDFPKGKKKDPMAPRNDDDSSDEDIPIANRKTLGPLARMQWLRVVIDEAQSIRNRSTRISTCVAKLDSQYRWCLTGTPITNTLADIYGFMRFCRFTPWNDWKLFNQSVAKLQTKKPIRAGQKAQAILKPHLLRRTKDSTLDGRPIIRLGPKSIDMIELEFTPEEREIYQGVETSQKKIVSRFLKEGTVMKNYSFILVMILRLRQLCCHPSLAYSEAESEELNAEKEKAEAVRAEQLMGAQKVKEIKERFKARTLLRMKADIGLLEPENDECAICMEPIVGNRRVTSCAHEFCSDCINEVLQKAEGNSGEDGAHCPLCRSMLDKNSVFTGKIFEPSAEELEKLSDSLPKSLDTSSTLERPSKKSRVDGAMKDGVSGDKDDFDLQSLAKDDNIEPSTKMRQMLESILKWRTECPEDKTIVYSQWTSMLDLVEDYLKRSGIEIVRYDGRMNRLARVESIVKFKKPTGPKIMLVSLKCGGVGLNLTVANRVINLDLAWNYATEAQAYDRVHRLGQQKAVEIHRVIIRGTIEERIIRLQAKKQGLSDAALGEGTGSKLQRMTPRDIAQLFDLK